jgi:hypothetical protein
MFYWDQPQTPEYLWMQFMCGSTLKQTAAYAALNHITAISVPACSVIETIHEKKNNKSKK